MKIRESGMPKEEEWNRFFDPSKILSLLSLSQKVVDVADFGLAMEHSQYQLQE